MKPLLSSIEIKSRLPQTRILNERISDLHEYRLYLAILGLLFLAYSTALFSGNDHLQTIANSYLPIVLLISSLTLAYKLVIKEPLLLWSPIPWFLIATACYFGLGPLSCIWGSDVSITRIFEIIDLAPRTLAVTNLLNVVGTFFTTAGYLATRRILRESSIRQRMTTTKAGLDNAKFAATWLVSIGLIFVFVFSLPYEFGFSTFVLPGMFFMLALLPVVAIVLLANLSWHCGGGWTKFYWAVFSLDFVLAILRFSKAEMIQLLMLSTLGSYLATRDRKSLYKGAAILILTYVVLCPFIGWCRSRIANHIGNIQQFTLTERLGVVQEAIQELYAYGTLDEGKNAEEWWIRLNYANAQALAIKEYDENRAGNSLSQAIFVFIPRILWPSKPVMTDVGVDFNELAVGHRGSSMSIGTYGEAYWNGGWFMVAVISTYVGAVYAWLTRAALHQMSNQQWLHLLGVFIGIRLGTRVDAWIVPDFIGGFIIYLAYSFAISSIYRSSLVKNNRRRIRSKDLIVRPAVNAIT